MALTKTKKKKLKTIPVNINRKRWLNADSLRPSVMRDGDGHQCCLGFVARACGIKTNNLIDLPYPVSVARNYFHLKSELMPGNFKRLFKPYSEGVIHKLEVNKAIGINDDKLLTPEERERKIIKVLAPLGFKIKFFG